MNYLAYQMNQMKSSYIQTKICLDAVKVHLHSVTEFPHKEWKYIIYDYDTR